MHICILGPHLYAAAPLFYCAFAIYVIQQLFFPYRQESVVQKYII